MRRSLAILSIALFALSASAAPRRDDGPLFERIFKAVQKIVRHIGRLDEIVPPKG
jgi:hypothetical protein